MKRLAIYALSLTFCLSGTATGGSDVVAFSSPDPALRRSEKLASPEFDATWRGKLALTGKLIVEFDRPPPGTKVDRNEEIIAQSFFEPDAISWKKLPRALAQFPKQDKHLWLPQSPSQLLTPLIGGKRARLVMKGEAARYELPVKVQLTSFSSHVDCDWRHFTMTFSSMSMQLDDLLAQNEHKYLGC